ncbi:MAG: DUF6146 family protein [Mariniphaga sp.]|jgi:hypothetical protein|nr:DUF6146 family protein [Mariniphaga sp.]
MKTIKQLLFLFLFAAISIIIACSTQKGIVQIESNKQEVEQKDSTEYELIVFDTRFETWYQLHNSPAKYRSQSYYENWNRQYVSAWNYNAMQPGRRSFFETIVGYEPNVDYGFELNHKLFYYFQYVERVLKIEIMPNGPRSIVF